MHQRNNDHQITRSIRILYNQQGDVIALVDGTGAKVVEYGYDAWGKPTSKTGSLAGALGTVQPFRYRGYVYDEETGDYYLRSRYYRPERGRFLNADDIEFTLSGDNLYKYCQNNPILYHDKSGMDYELNDNWINISIMTSVIENEGRNFQITKPNANYQATLNDVIKASDAYAVFCGELKSAKEKSLSDPRTPLHRFNIHHIVPQGSSKGAPAQIILRNHGINYRRDVRNHVVVSTKMHWYMHTQDYYASVNDIIRIADEYPGDPVKNIEEALTIMRETIDFVDNYWMN